MAAIGHNRQRFFGNDCQSFQLKNGTMEENEAIRQSLSLLETQPDLSSPDFKENRNKLILAVNELIHRDFSKLLRILYRIDVEEHKLKTALFESPLPAAETIADLIIERQIQKIKFREMFRKQ